MTSVLVVEDDAHMLEMVLFVLSREGYRVRGVVNGKEAMDVAKYFAKQHQVYAGRR